jgi:hypothetical protein
MLGAGVCWILLRRNRPHAAVVSYAATAGAFSLAVFAFAGPKVDEDRLDLQLLDTVATRSAEPQIFAYGALEPSWVFYAGRPIREFRTSEPPEVTAALAKDENTYLLATEEAYDKLRTELPPELEVLDRRPRFLRRSQMLLIGKSRTNTVLETQAPQRGATLR